MKTFLTTAIGLLSASLLVSACAANSSPSPNDPNEEPTAGEGKADGLSADNWTYYSVRPDYRKCAWPYCGGYWVKRVNQPSTKCSSGGWASECYVTEVDWSEIGLSEEEQGALEPASMVLRGSITQRQSYGKTYAVFAASEGWSAATEQAPSGTFYRAKDSGIVCITYPCPTIEATRLNRNKKPTTNYAGLDLGPSGATQEQLDAAWQELTGDNGLVVAATTEDVKGPAGSGTGLSASQFYTRVVPKAPVTACHKTGCSGEICAPADQDIISICIYKAEYDCYKQATCEQQASGKCGFTVTPDLQACLKAAGAS